ncbi:hypothetical protein SDC9_203576 [bioreactor metagenome]|uniref:Uncharacterized protein n=1 Tax=bioreactor metagenome TaxID=1076179 RepID=A0A645IYF8_9ZZZZ
MAVYRVASKGSVSKHLFTKDKNYLKKQMKIWSNIDLLNRYSDYKFNVEFESKKKQKAFVSIYSDNLTFRQVFFLIWKYKLYREPVTLVNFFKNKIYSIWIDF